MAKYSAPWLQGAVALLEAGATSLDLSGRDIDDSGVGELVKAIRQCPSLKLKSLNLGVQ